ncbi:MAG: lipopolysaccharide biosynthesis protein [Raoultibacter sp.]
MADQQGKQRKPTFIERTVNGWFNRLLGAASEGSFGAQEEQYAANRTSRDYIWNTVGITAWGMVFPALTIVATQLVGVEQAGMFSMAFVVGMLLMIVANYGVRTYQVSDIEEAHSFSDYQINRLITCAIMLLVGGIYCAVRGYGEDMLVISMGVYSYKMIDGLADVYEGRLQQMGKLYLAGISQAVRSILVLIVFSLCLLITHNLAVSSVAMALAALVSFVLFTLPLALLETPKSRTFNAGCIRALFKQCFPLFLALFLYALVDNMPKFVMEGVLSYDNQLYFNALYFPAQGILLTIGLIYKPQLVRMTNLWADVEKRKRFDLMMVVVLALIIALTLGMIFVMGWIGIPVMSFMYGIDFEQFRGLCFIMLVAGGVTAAIDFLYQVITVLRQQKAVTKLYLIAFGFSLFIPILLVQFTGLPGIVIGYLIVMSILLVLLVWEYLRIRLGYFHEAKAQSKQGEPQLRPSELRAQRDRLKQHRGSGVNKDS